MLRADRIRLLVKLVTGSNRSLVFALGEAWADPRGWPQAVYADLTAYTQWHEFSFATRWTFSQWVSYLQNEGRGFIRQLVRLVVKPEVIKRHLQQVRTTSATVLHANVPTRCQECGKTSPSLILLNG